MENVAKSDDCIVRLHRQSCEPLRIPREHLEAFNTIDQQVNGVRVLSEDIHHGCAQHPLCRVEVSKVLEGPAPITGLIVALVSTALPRNLGNGCP